MPHRSFAKPMSQCFAGVIVVGLLTVGCAAPAAAYRPFDGTDAAVADVGEVEIEFQPTGAWHVDKRNSRPGPDGVFNYVSPRDGNLFSKAKSRRLKEPAPRACPTEPSTNM
jgi:hypothetical protein